MAALFSTGSRAATPPVPAHWSVEELRAGPLAPGANFSVHLLARIDPRWHIYALEEPEGGPAATEIGLAESDPVALLRVAEERPQMLPDPFYKQSTGLFRGGASFTLFLQLPRESLPRETVLHVQIRYQACSDRMCLAPQTSTVAVPLAPILR